MDPTLARGSLTLVIDASAALGLALSEAGFDLIRDEDAVAPPLLWSEVLSALHEHVWRRTITPERATAALDRFAGSGIRSRSPRELMKVSWAIADQLGWAKTYDAEYIALASALRCDLSTLDSGLRDGAIRAGVRVRAIV